MKRLILLTALLLFAAGLGGCKHPAAINPVISVMMGSRAFTLEVAATPDSQKAGLSDRDSLPADRGLIYVYVDETEHYRAENAHFPLDVIFVNSAGVVVTMRTINANDATAVRSDKPAFYAIELNRGTADAAGIKVGNRIPIPAAASRMAIARMQIGRSVFDLEVARTSDEQEIGLMNRDSLPEGREMIFVFPEQRTRDFWMKNTRVPLDIVFLDNGGTVVSIRQMAPFDESLTSSNAPAHYAIELNKGAAETADVKAGDRLIIPVEAKSK